MQKLEGGMLRMLTPVAMAIAFVGCLADGPPSEALHGDVNFTTDERAAIERGNAWVSDHIGRSRLEIVWDLPHPAQPNEGGPRSITRGITDPTVLGGADADNARIELWVRRLDLLAAVAAHEIGHVRGLHHHAGPGLMNKDVELVVVGVPVVLLWTEDDEVQCRLDGVCH